MKATVAKKNARTRRATPRRTPDRGAQWQIHVDNGVKFVEAPQFAKLHWLAHGFSTRVGGASKMPSRDNASAKRESALNLGFTNWDSRENVLENRDRFFRAIEANPVRVVTLHQIHSDIVHVIDGKHLAHNADPPKGDALVTLEKGIVLAVQTADCIPILLADSKRKAVAAIHAGWRGTLQRIAEKTVGRMQMEFGTQPKDVIAALGPGIGGCCYEVGHEVAKEFAAKYANAREWFDGPFDAVSEGDNDPNWLPWLTMKPPGHAPPPIRVHLDLIAANRAILIGAGVLHENISGSNYCTGCRTDLFFSYRREHETGRMMAAIRIT